MVRADQHKTYRIMVQIGENVHSQQLKAFLKNMHSILEMG
jgi:tRNA U54 and U55 pseudouridine synthase Pus10